MLSTTSVAGGDSLIGPIRPRRPAVSTSHRKRHGPVAQNVNVLLMDMQTRLQPGSSPIKIVNGSYKPVARSEGRVSGRKHQSAQLRYSASCLGQADSRA